VPEAHRLLTGASRPFAWYAGPLVPHYLSKNVLRDRRSLMCSRELRSRERGRKSPALTSFTGHSVPRSHRGPTPAHLAPFGPVNRATERVLTDHSVARMLVGQYSPSTEHWHPRERSDRGSPTARPVVEPSAFFTDVFRGAVPAAKRGHPTMKKVVCTSTERLFHTTPSLKNRGSTGHPRRPVRLLLGAYSDSENTST